MKKVLEYLLYLFVFLLPWQTRWIIYDAQINPEYSGGVWEYGRIAIYGFDVVFLVLSIMYYVLCIKKKLVISNWKLAISLIALLLYCFITILFISDYKILSLYWSLRILQGVLLIWILSKINFSKIKLAWSFVVSMALSAGLGIYQFLTQSAFASKWLGMAAHSARDLGVSVVEFGIERWLRAYGGMPHPNVLAGFCLIAIILCIWLINKTQNSINPPTRRAGKTQEKIKILFYYFITLLLVAGLFFTFSRAAWIALLVLCIMYFVLCIKNKLLNCQIVKLLISICLLLVILSIIYWPLVENRVLAEQRLEVKSNIERMAGYEQAWQVIKNNPLLGVGMGNYTNELQKMYPDRPAWAYQPVHNVYLLVLAELGIVGVLILVLLLFRIVLSIKYYVLSNKNFIFLLLCSFVLLFLFDHFWWTLPSGMLLVFLSLGFLKKLPDKTDGNGRKVPWGPRPFTG